MMRYFIGIDVGANGAVSVIQEDCVINYQFSFDRDKMIMFFSTFWEVFGGEGQSAVACVEKVGAMPGQGVTSMFNFGKNAGYIEGILEMAEIPYQLVPPAKWKKEFSLLNKDKKASIEVCKKLFPGVNLLPTKRCTKESDNLADSLLMAEYARRKFK